MTKKSSTALTAAAAVGVCTLGSQLFVLPGATPKGAAQRAVATAAPQLATSTSSSSTAVVIPLLGLGALGVAVAARSSASRTEKVARNFFGGSSSYYKSFDPATEAGVQDPVGCWDPLGRAADKEEATFQRRRAVEIKHGRIAMYATMGYIVPEYYKVPGDLSPSLGIKFADVPAGLAAFSKAVPAVPSIKGL